MSSQSPDAPAPAPVPGPARVVAGQRRAPPAKPPTAKKPDGKSDGKPESIGEYYSRWEKQAKAMDAATNSIDWSGMDWSKLKASDIGVRFGPALTEEQFKALQAAKGRQNVVGRAQM